MVLKIRKLTPEEVREYFPEEPTDTVGDVWIQDTLEGLIPHTHKTVVDDCFRCDLSNDEMLPEKIIVLEGVIESLVEVDCAISKSGKHHFNEYLGYCTFCKTPSSNVRNSDIQAY